MFRPPLSVPLLGLLLSLPALRAQGEKESKSLPCRVISSGQGKATLIDRGLRDGLRKGDSLILRPRQGGEMKAKVSSVSSRSAAITLIGSRQILAPGTPGEIRIPKDRLRSKNEGKKPGTGQAGTGAPPPTKGTANDPAKSPAATPGGTPGGTPGKNTPEDAKPSWRNQDRDYREGMPLLTGLRPRRPKDRATRITGSVYAIADLTIDRSGTGNSLFRVGTNLAVENFLQYGDLRFDGEINYAMESNDIAGMDLLVRGLSYVMGGNRFESHRLEFGRFLQYGIPEFQYLDGLEWGFRLANSSRIGASIGFMPEPDADFESMSDAQFAIYYEWVDSLTETLSLTAAYQKTFHRGTADRDLLLTKLRYSPEDAWNVNGTLWVDFYDSRDQTRNSPLEITDAWLSFNRLYDDGSGMDLTYRHSTFPEIVRKEFIEPFPPIEIAGSRYDRLSWRSWKAYSDDSRLHARLTGWTDQDGSGWSADTGFEWADWFQAASRTDVSLYGGASATVNTLGARIDYRVPSTSGNWNWLYDISFRHNVDIADDRDDFLQHRLRGSHDFKIFGAWEAHLYSEARLWDLEPSWSAGFYIQRSF